MSDKLISGVYAAVLTPRTTDNSVDTEALTSEIKFLLSKGVSSFAVNGATGEFCITTPQQLQQILRHIRSISGEKAGILCGVGAPSITVTMELAKVAQSEGVKGLLLPMPYFFPYSQDDLEVFCREVAAGTPLPILLYNLPQFTSGLEKETVRRLITEVSNLIGIKDSSGSLDILRDLTEHGIDACRIVGNDNALCAAMREDVCDGVVSGVACVLPELIRSMYAQFGRTGTGEFAGHESILLAFTEQLGALPTPWGLKWIAQARGLFQPTFNMPLSAARKAQAAEFVEWFQKREPQLTVEFADARR